MFKAHRLLYHSTLGVRVIEKKKKKRPHIFSASETAGGSVAAARRGKKRTISKTFALKMAQAKAGIWP